MVYSNEMQIPTDFLLKYELEWNRCCITCHNLNISSIDEGFVILWPPISSVKLLSMLSPLAIIVWFYS